MSKPTGLDWGAISERYVASGGEPDPSVWRSAAPGPERSSRPGGRHRNRQPKGVAPGPARQLTNTEERRVKERYEAGESSPALAQEYQMTPATIRKIVLRQGGTIRTISEAVDRNPLTDEQKAELLQRYEAGESSEALAREFGITPRTSRRTIVRQGGTIRNKSEATKLARNREK